MPRRSPDNRLSWSRRGTFGRQFASTEAKIAGLFGPVVTIFLAQPAGEADNWSKATLETLRKGRFR